jgi:hypothetical protein
MPLTPPDSPKIGERRYDVELAVCTVLGVAWLVLLGRTTYNLQHLRAKDWAIGH